MIDQQERFSHPLPSNGRSLDQLLTAGGFFLFMKVGRKPVFWKDRFWTKVDIRGEDECWEWKAGCAGKYGSFSVTHAKAIGAHRIAFFLGTGRWPDPELEVCHTCDNPPCCNPKHLWEGTSKENAQDAIRKGRKLVGGEGPSTKLTWDIVRQIRKERAYEGTSFSSIAKKHGVCRTAIGHIIHNQTWCDPAIVDTGPLTFGPRPNSAGEKHPKARLTWKIVEQIREEWLTTSTTLAEFAKRYSVGLNTIAAIVYNKNWKSSSYIPQRRTNRTRVVI